MGNYWITTHWPIPPTDVAFTRHVFVKEGHATLPQPGDTLFIRETKVARDKDRRPVRVVSRHHRGKVVAGFRVPKGTGGIVGVATVDGAIREQRPEDVVFDYGDLPEWRVIPCRGFRQATLPLEDLRVLLDIESVRGLNLWKMPETLGPKLLMAIR